MAPILLDKRDLLKLGIVSVLTIVLAFAAGFKFGQRQAVFSQATPGIEHAALGPVQASPASKASNLRQYNDAISASSSGSEPAVATASDTGSKTKDALPTEKSHVAKVADKRLVGQQHSSQQEIGQPQPSKQQPSKQQPSKQQVQLHQVESTNKTRSASDSLRTGEVAVQANATALEKDSGSSTDVAKYSIQVAVYARLINAKSMMESLQEKNLDAYITDYINKKNRTRFTVRFGYFKDKDSARQALKSYIRKHDGDGYLVNFSSDDIVDVPQAKVIQQAPQDNLKGGAQ